MSGFLNHKNARTPDQQKLMETIERDGVCPFCAEHFVTYHPKPVLAETPFWFFTENMSPYKGTKYHFIFVYKPAHISSLADLPAEAFADLHSMLKEAVSKYSIFGGSFFMRFGDTQYNGSSVSHLHAHLLMGDADAPGHEAVKVKLG
ncbi:MAG TPA: HIT domain-containing protein [Candidatus Paceibacterota bacterium]